MEIGFKKLGVWKFKSNQIKSKDNKFWFGLEVQKMGIRILGFHLIYITLSI